MRAPLVAVAAVVAVGILLDRLQTDLLTPRDLPTAGTTFWWALVPVVLGVWRWLHQGGRAYASAAVLLLATALLAAGWHHWSWNVFASDEAGRLAGEVTYPCALEAVVLAAPERVASPPASAYRAIPQGEKSQTTLQIVRVRNGPRWQAASGACELIVDGHLQGVGAQDRVRLFGQWSKPSGPRNPGQFDFASHSRADRQLLLVRCESPDCVTVLATGSGWMPTVWIDRLRDNWRRRLWQTFGEQHAPMASALLIGARGSMPRERVQTFRVTGALHVLVVSGLHAGILVSMVFVALGLGLLSRRRALLLAMLLIAFYTLLTGAHPPVVRAAVLAELACLALLLGVNPFAINSLAAAAVVVLMLNPANLFRTGTQLSFLCAAILLWFSSVRWRAAPTPLARLLHSVRPWHSRLLLRLGKSAGVIAGATLAVWLVSTPLLLLSYNLATPVAVLISPLLFPLMVVTLLSGFAYLVGGWLLPFTKPLLAAVSQGSVAALDSLVTQASELPGGYLWSPAPVAWWVMGWYVLAAVLLVPGGVRFGWRRTIQLAAVWILVGALPAFVARLGSEPAKVAFLDVGHGVCTVVTTPDGSTLLYDAGSLGSPSFAADTISSYLWSRGIRSIDGIVLSHPDVDHFNALPGLVDRFAIGRVFVSSMMFPRQLDQDDTSAPAELQRLLQSRGIATEIVEMGDRLTIDSHASALVLYPDRLGNLGSDNANSLVLAIELAGRRILLPGDLESPGIDHVMADVPYDCDLLLAPHHGSRRSDPPGFAAWSKPEWTIVSGGSMETNSQVTASYQQRGGRLLSTAESGAIEFELHDRRLVVKLFVNK